MMNGDLPKHRGKRLQLVKQLRELDIKDEAVLRAIESVPRHLFLDQAFETFAYENKAFKIGSGQTISQPYTVAFQSALLQPLKGMKVLEIGTGSGYQSSILHFLGAKVFSIERQKALHDKAKLFLPEMGVMAKLFYGDGYQGLPLFAPFDRIIVTAAAPEIPKLLKLQMKIGGIMVVPVGDSTVQRMLEIHRSAENDWRITEHGEFKFVPMLEEKE
jgi:protein-L-isoaspartate(D-aspartate) O-methyltransferase